MRRFSIRTAMAFVLVSAVGMAALRNASDLWAGIMFLVALGAVGVAVMFAVGLRGPERFSCAGFAFFGGGYLVLAILAWPRETVQPMLGTTFLFEELYSWMIPEASAKTALEAGIAAYERASNFYPFRRVGHSLFALLAGWAGGTFASWLYMRRERGEAVAE